MSHGSTSVFYLGLILLEENRPIPTYLHICAEMWARRIICNSENLQTDQMSKHI